MHEGGLCLRRPPFFFARELRVFKAFMDPFYPTTRLSLIPVPGVGHDGPVMYASPHGGKALFFYD
jgi:hypothetical protein